MDAVALIRRLHQHRAWVNEKLLASAARLDDARLRRPYPIGQGSVWNTLLHRYAAEYVWLEAGSGSFWGSPAKLVLTALSSHRPAWPGLSPRMSDSCP